MKLEDSKILIVDSENLLKEIEMLYVRDLRVGEDSPLLRVRIKQFVDNMNSALDYAAFAAFTEYCAPRIKVEKPEKLKQKERRVYFPCVKERSDFNKKISENFEYLREEKLEIVGIFEKYQPFPAKSKWLDYLKELVNSNKHRNLTKQTMQHTQKINRIVSSNGASIINGTIISEDGFFPFKFADENGNESPIISNDSEHIIEFMFSNIDQPVIPTLRRIIRSVPTIIRDLEKI